MLKKVQLLNIFVETKTDFFVYSLMNITFSQMQCIDLLIILLTDPKHLNSCIVTQNIFFFFQK